MRAASCSEVGALGDAATSLSQGRSAQSSDAGASEGVVGKDLPPRSLEEEILKNGMVPEVRSVLCVSQLPSAWRV